MPCAAIVGAGLIGQSWATIFAAAGWSVRVTDPVPAALAAAPAAIAAALRALESSGLVTDAAACVARIETVGSLAEALADADLVQENGPEVLETKRRLFRELDEAAAPATIIASSTSAIPASAFTEDLPGRARCLVAHPVNPPHLIGLVELSGAPWTDPAVVERARTLYRSIGQKPVVLHKEIEGFVLNRLQGAVLSEAFKLVGQGVISAADIDLVMTEGLAPRWCFLGPLATIDLNAPGGIADYCARFGPFYQRLAADAPGPEVWDAESVAALIEQWAEVPQAGDRARRTEARNALLRALRAFKLDLDTSDSRKVSS